jgi:hypothetical protein
MSALASLLLLTLAWAEGLRRLARFVSQDANADLHDETMNADRPRGEWRP